MLYFPGHLAAGSKFSNIIHGALGSSFQLVFQSPSMSTVAFRDPLLTFLCLLNYVSFGISCSVMGGFFSILKTNVKRSLGLPTDLGSPKLLMTPSRYEG